MTPKAPRVYRLLLLFLPPRFRQDFGADLEAVLVARLRDAPGPAARAWVWLIAVVDVFMSAPAEWANAFRDQRTGNPRGSTGMDHLKLDFRFALRSLARRPGFAAIAVITLGLGIGANTAIFSVVNGVLLRPLPYLEPDRLGMVWEPRVYAPTGRLSTSGPGIEDVRELGAISVVEGFTRPSQVTVTTSGEPELMNATGATGGLLAVFDLRPALGRDLTHEDDLEGAAPVVVIGHDFWQSRLGGRRDVIGTTIELNERSYEVVGVAPAGFRFPVGGSLDRKSVV